MRPVERGTCPTEADDIPKKFRKYQDAQVELVARIGKYCSYCERSLSNAAIEHKRPRKWHPILECDWDNFLLACSNCNSTKGARNIQLEDYYWADQDNTARAFEYHKAGTIYVNSCLTLAEQQLAQNTLELTGLNKVPSHPSIRDDRWQTRRDVWNMAEEFWNRLQTSREPEGLKAAIVQLALAKGFWSVWMTVFHEDSDMLNRLIQAFPGTCRSCFDDQGRPILRAGGAL
jgi:uncharacterized protein (TIGR02646 family)